MRYVLVLVVVPGRLEFQHFAPRRHAAPFLQALMDIYTVAESDYTELPTGLSQTVHRKSTAHRESAFCSEGHARESSESGSVCGFLGWNAGGFTLQSCAAVPPGHDPPR